MSTARPFRFAVLATGARDARAWREQAADAEALGYQGFLVPDHLGQEWGPLVSLAMAADATRDIALGPLMLAVDLRNPVVLYKELATLAHCAPGRLEIGVGAGWWGSDYTRSGLAMARPGVRIGRLDEAVGILKELWTGGGVTRQDGHYRVAGALGQPRPPADAAVRWTLGGGGRRVLEVAARHADIVSLSATLSNPEKGAAFGASATIDMFQERVAWVRDAAGDRFADIELQCPAQAVAVTADRERYGSRVLSRMFGLAAAEALESPLALVGTVDQLCDRLQRLRDRLGISYWVVPGAQLRPFADVVARLANS